MVFLNQLRRLAFASLVKFSRWAAEVSNRVLHTALRDGEQSRWSAGPLQIAGG
jgi:hypothetical protein